MRQNTQSNICYNFPIISACDLNNYNFLPLRSVTTGHSSVQSSDDLMQNSVTVKFSFQVLMLFLLLSRCIEEDVKITLSPIESVHKIVISFEKDFEDPTFCCIGE